MHRRVGIVEAVVPVGHEAAVGEHAARPDLHPLDRGDHHDPEVEGLPAPDGDARGARPRDPHSGLEQDPLPELDVPRRASRARLPWVWPADERAAAQRVPVDARAVPRPRVALVEVPRPEERLGGGSSRTGSLPQRHRERASRARTSRTGADAERLPRAGRRLARLGPDSCARRRSSCGSPATRRPPAGGSAPAARRGAPVVLGVDRHVILADRGPEEPGTAQKGQPWGAAAGALRAA